MARQTEFDPNDPDVPLWLSHARQIAEIIDVAIKQGEGENFIAEQTRRATDIPVHRAREYERAYRFLVAHHANQLALKRVRANFNAISNLRRLNEFNPVRATQIAADVLGGKLVAHQVRGILDEALSASPGDIAPRQAENRRRTARFVIETRATLSESPDLLELGPVDEVIPVPYGMRFAPQLVVRQGGRLIAIEICAASAAMSPSEVGHYNARLALLEQKYDRAILVMPPDRADVAEQVRRFQREWDGRDVCVVLMR